MRGEELQHFLFTHKIDYQRLAEILGVSQQAVISWLKETRKMPVTTARLLFYFDENPDSMQEFELVVKERYK